jgi:hypothetical protein
MSVRGCPPNRQQPTGKDTREEERRQLRGRKRDTQLNGCNHGLRKVITAPLPATPDHAYFRVNTIHDYLSFCKKLLVGTSFSCIMKSECY